MNQSKRNLAFLLMCIMSSTTLLAATPKNQLPVLKKVSFVNDMSLQVDLQWLDSAQTLALFIENPSGEAFRVVLRDASGDILIRSNVINGKRKFEQYFRFESADPGKYGIDVYVGKTVIHKNIKFERMMKPVVNMSIE